ncbi:MAG: hypothetical protein GWN67_11825 [Phycisphaerae bacterium]|nr:hypothetical protein [Phycisphaerae bacterium]NIW72810.1 hypothetical protein [candidate division KSB1 bacterium]NIP52781.1 hypothetical protein [Phycisphaerae bacterium]NIS51797.1 hypothetical protein [Phycisphaerae bacterium]NIU09326.1 hypothetical protein [Phycisphaerae bacterium]
MNASLFRKVRVKRCSGYSGLMILMVAVSVLIGCLIWINMVSSPFAPFHGTVKDRYSDPNAYPWQEGHLFIRGALDGYDMGGRRPPFPIQPQFTNLLNYSAEVYSGDNKYGRIEMEVCDDGDVRASWSGEFELMGKRYQAVKPRIPARKEMNMFFGNYAPLKVYEDENGRDPSKLYVITDGVFELKDPASKDGIASDSIKDMAFITCWIDRDLKAAGRLSIPSFEGQGMLIFQWGPVAPVEK